MEVKVINKSGLDLPKYESLGAAGFDFKSTIDITLEPNVQQLIPTGLYVEIPLIKIPGVGYELQVRPKSGLALKHGVTVLNTPGCIDEDYRGEIGVILINLSKVPYHINKGDKIAQGILSPIRRITWKEVEELSSTERGEGGFGSTGK